MSASATAHAAALRCPIGRRPIHSSIARAGFPCRTPGRQSSVLIAWVYNDRSKRDLDAEALAALDEARSMPHGPERTEAMRKAGILRNAADLQGIISRSAEDPRKLRLRRMLKQFRPRVCIISACQGGRELTDC
jgi:hypothetical protein